METPQFTGKTTQYHFQDYTVTFNGREIIVSQNGKILSSRTVTNPVSTFYKATVTNAKLVLENVIKKQQKPQPAEV